MIMMHFGKKQIVTTVLWHRNEFPWGNASNLGYIRAKTTIHQEIMSLDG
jgi:hypothetical protein